MTRHRLLTLTLLATLAGCGYFNTMYNAKRAFADAEKAATRGDAGAAELAYRTSLEKAQKSITKDPDGRWSGEARMIAARSLYALRDYGGAAAIFHELLQHNADRRAAALIYLGLIAADLDEDSLALRHLDAALRERAADDALRAHGHYTRARVQFKAGNIQAASAALVTAASSPDPGIRTRAELMRARIALLSNDTAVARRAFDTVLRSPDARRWVDSIRAVAVEAAPALGGMVVRSWLEPGLAAWSGGGRDTLLLLRTDLALQAGDTASAMADLEILTARSTGTQADLYRVRNAELRMALTRTPQELTDVRAFLLPAIGTERGLSLVQSIKTFEVLLERAARPEHPVALFAAAELARDELGAKRVALRLFNTFADLASKTVWAPKALLAAIDLDDGPAADALRARFESYTGNPYVTALARAGDDEAYAAADSTLSVVLQELRMHAVTEAQQRDNSVNRAVTLIDSARIAARLDSTRVACTRLLDSLAVKGIRADSMRTACERGDRNRVNLLIRIDTLRLKDTTRVRVDTIRSR